MKISFHLLFRFSLGGTLEWLDFYRNNSNNFNENQDLELFLD